ncbi:MAG: hypothetical protein L6R40_007588 [Gallowayella cf. fulva]|nr:MAG: hypothetical protein L6R40_007588 [Xanthomendoza cf. fulva]
MQRQLLPILLSILLLPLTHAVRVVLSPAQAANPPAAAGDPPYSRATASNPFAGPNPFAGINPIAGINVQVCNNLRPGRCCQGRPAVFAAPGVPPYPDFRVSQVQGMAPRDIAAVWHRARGAEGGCTGTSLASSAGPGNWRYPAEGNANDILTGASYIRVPDGAPEDVEAPWVEAEGILGMVTGGGKWVAKGVSNMLQKLIDERQRALAEIRGGSKARKRSIRSREKGAVFARPPSVGVWPDVIVLNGTEYTEESAGSPIYRSQEGKMLNFTSAAG